MDERGEGGERQRVRGGRRREGREERDKDEWGGREGGEGQR